jgi:hypothetical protein
MHLILISFEAEVQGDQMSWEKSPNPFLLKTYTYMTFPWGKVHTYLPQKYCAITATIKNPKLIIAKKIAQSGHPGSEPHFKFSF